MSSYLALLRQAHLTAASGEIDLAINQLEAFIQHVRAQAGKHITEAQADAMILAVERIIAGLRAGYV